MDTVISLEGQDSGRILSESMDIMGERYAIGKTCDVKNHRSLMKTVGQIEGIEVLYCPICEALTLTRVHWETPQVRSLRRVGQAFKSIVPKAPSENSIEKVALQQDLIRYCVENFGMGSDAVTGAIRWLLSAGKDFKLSVNGVPYGLHIGLRAGYVGLVRMPLDGDPPVAYPVYRCPVCGQEHNLEDIVADGVFLCPCGSSYRYGLGIEPLVRIKLSEACDFQGNYLRAYLKNTQSRAGRYSVNLFLNGSPIGLLPDNGWHLASGQDGVQVVRNPPGLVRAWNEGDVLQAEVCDCDSGEVLAWSQELTWSERPWSPLVAAAGIAAAGLALVWACSPKKE